MIFIVSVSFFALIASEVVLQAIVRYFRKDFQWLITEKDEYPEFDKDAFRKFIKSSYDKELGWVRKPNTNGIERGKYGNITYYIDEVGSRKNTITGETSIVTFGDSYTFCRQVEDSQTWQVYLSKELGGKVLNFGVGNYGADQALLYYQRQTTPITTKVVILGFVPETICRVQSYWKHYLEFGNIFAFKPMFTLENGKLAHHKNLIGNLGGLSDIDEAIKFAKNKDLFYKSKFRRFQFRFPYLLRYLLNFQRHSVLFYLLARKKIFSAFRIKNSNVENAPFSKIMLDNIKYSHDMYGSSYACNLLEKILVKFCDEAYRRGHKPLVLVMPQLIDIKIINKQGNIPYSNFFSKINDKVPVLDMTTYVNNSNVEDLYTDDMYGGHFSELGNKLVADKVLHYLKNKVLQ
jgi:hypothetical protein